MTSKLHRLLQRVRYRLDWLLRPNRLPVQLYLGAALAAAFAILAWQIAPHYPVSRWLFWRYAAYWVGALGWAVAAFSLGNAALEWCCPRPLRTLEQVTIGFGVGVYLFELAMFATGMLGLYGPVTFFALPLLAVALTSGPLSRFTTRALRAAGTARELLPQRRPAWRWGIVLFGFVGLLMLYLLILTPENVQFDARWKQMAIAEDYAVTGGIRRFGEGWTPGTRPHLASLLYTWAFLAPSAELFDQMLLSAHLEYVVFLVTTLVGIPAVVRRLVPGADPTTVWAARFLFPGVLLYDSSLCGGSDHLGAMLGPPIFLVTLLTYERLNPRWAALLGLLMASAATVKDTTAILLVPIPALVIAYRVATVALRRLLFEAGSPRAPRDWLWAPLAAALSVVVFTAPQWLKNLVWYGDPLYPMLHAYLWPRPWTETAPYVFQWLYKDTQMWAPERSLAGVLETLKVLVTWSFIPNDWPNLHGKVPVIGSLLTLFVLCLPALRRTGRLWLLLFYIHAGIFAWYWVHHQDRYLQGLMPLMAAALSACILLVWRTAWWPGRALVASLVGLQVVWGGDVWFIQTHAMIKAPLKEVADLFAEGFRARDQGLDALDRRLEVQQEWQDIGRATPEGARLLLHDINAHLGTRRQVVSDRKAWQLGIDYGLLRSPAEVHALYRSLGVTHVVYDADSSIGWDSLAGDLRFHEYAQAHLGDRRRVGGYVVAALRPEPPVTRLNDVALLLTCRGAWEPGLYPLSRLTTPVHGPAAARFDPPVRRLASAADAVALAAHASFLVQETRCYPKVVPEVAGQFGKLVSRHGFKRGRDYVLYLRRASAPPPVAL